MAKRKILFIGQFAPPVHGVSVMNDYVLHSKLLNNEFRFVKVNLTTAKSIENIGKSNPIKYLKFIFILLKTLTSLLVNKFHLVYLTLSPVGYAFIKDSLIVGLVKLFRVPVVLHLHGKGIDNAITRGGKKAYKQYNQVFNGTSVITLSAGLQNDIQQINSYKQVFVVNNGIPAMPVPEKQREAGMVKILMLSNLIKAKGALDLLAAANLLQARGLTGFKVIFAGAWGETGFADEFAQFVTVNNLQGFVELAGPVYGDAKKLLLAKADIFVLPTYYANECFPLTILEAMQFGIPVVATNEGAIPEMVIDAETGLIVPVRNPEKLATAIAKLYQNPELRLKMGKQAQHRFNNHFTLNIFEEHMRQVFNKTNS